MEAMKRIGKGHFTTAYMCIDGKVLLKSRDYIKECMAIGWFPNSRLFPKVDRGQHDGEYIMKYYPRVTLPKKSLKKEEYVFYMELREIDNSGYSGFDELWAAFHGLSNKYRGKILIQALEACANYGYDICFEISPRNISVSESGNLILMDCFFIRSQLRH